MGIRDSIQSILISNQDILEEYKYYGESEDEFIDYLEALSKIFGIEEIKDRDSLIEFIFEHDYYHLLNYRYYHTSIEKLRVKERHKDLNFKNITTKRQFFDRLINKFGVSVIIDILNYNEEEPVIQTTYDKLMANFTIQHAEYMFCAFFKSSALKYEGYPFDDRSRFQNAVRQQSIVSTEQFMEELITYSFVLTEGGAIANAAVSFFGPLQLTGTGPHGDEAYLSSQNSVKNLHSVDELGIDINMRSIRENYIDCFSRIDHLLPDLFKYFPHTRLTIYRVYDQYASDNYFTDYSENRDKFNYALSFTSHVKYAIEYFPDLLVIRFENCFVVSIDPDKIGINDYAEYRDISDPHNQTLGVSTLHELEGLDFGKIAIIFDHCWIDEEILGFLRNNNIPHKFLTRIVYDYEIWDYHHFDGSYLDYVKKSFATFSFPDAIDWLH